jgi:hypothetical protein
MLKKTSYTITIRFSIDTTVFFLSLFSAIIVFVTHAGALKATSLIHAKKATNATTTTTEAGNTADEAAEETEDTPEPEQEVSELHPF